MLQLGGVSIYATNLGKKSSQRKPMYSNEWGMSEINLMCAVSAIRGD
jgi:hypothetical protein